MKRKKILLSEKNMESSVSPLFKLGYIGTAPASGTKKTSETPSVAIPSRVTFPEKYPTISIGTFQPVGDIMSQGMSPIDQLIQANLPPSFETPSIPKLNLKADTRFDEVLQKLLEYGFIIDYRMYDNGKLTHLLATTKQGDRVLIQVDNLSYQSTFPSMFNSSDVQMRSLPNVTFVPQETKIGALECLNYDVCGVAFVCEGNICMTQKKNGTKEMTYSEKNYTFQSSSEIGAGVIGHALVAYPIISLSTVLANPQKAEDQIASVAGEIHEISLKKLYKQHERLEEALNKLKEQITSEGQFIRSADFALDSDIDKLTQIYHSLKEINPDEMSDSQQEAYYVVLRNLKEKKALRSRLINMTSTAHAITNSIQSLSKEFEQLVNPLMQKHSESLGQISD